MTIDAIKILIPAVMAFSIGMMVAPTYINLLTRLEIWKKKSAEKTIDGHEATLTKQINGDEKRKIPRMGGVLIWGSVLTTSLILWILPRFIHFIPDKLDIVSRNQTWLILFGMVVAGVLGAIDDISSSSKYVPGIGSDGLRLRYRLLVVLLISLFMGWWFFVKLGFDSVFLPFVGMVYVGSLIYFLITFFSVGMFSVSNIDGIDGLSGGLFATAFGSFGIIALAQNQVDIAAFCFAVVGGCLAFLWWNIHPAKFYNSETGLLSLSISLTLVAFLTNQLVPLIIICLPLISAPASAIIQIASKRLRSGKKVFLVAPLHYHFQMKGLASQTVVMRYWLFGVMCAFVGVVVALAGTL
jgi:phospho-N-acetylmuramoyl-pentapeptide-transferase